jgi:RNA polymerase sigma-70 factor (ECF subfamily)
MQQRSSVQAGQEPPSDDAALFDRYGSIIFAYTLRHTDSREDAEDLTLEVFTAAMEHNDISQLQPTEQLAWLKRVTHNKLIDSYRRAQRRVNVNIDFFAETLYGEEEPEHIAIQNETHQQLHQYIRQLSPIHQQLLYLRYAHNLRAAEIGTILNKSAESIRQQLTRARMLLRASYLKQEQEGERSC